jgi:hypothetical protein
MTLLCGGRRIDQHNRKFVVDVGRRVELGVVEAEEVRRCSLKLVVITV